MTHKRNDMSWYDPTLNMNQMAKKAGITRERVRQLLNFHNLMPEYKAAEKQRKQKGLEALSERIKEVYKPGMTLDELTSILHVCDSKLKSAINECNLDIQFRGYRDFSDLSWWYDPNLTVKEMAQKSNVLQEILHNVLRYKNLPYKRKRFHKEENLDWYDPNKTLAEMAKLANKTTNNICQQLRYRNLPYKKVLNQDMPWYDPELTISQMVKKSGLRYQSIWYDLQRRNLPYKIERRKK